jgi:TMEM175 potassium channel family protein
VVPAADPEPLDPELDARATDRLTLFSDAVVAIAITLLAIDLPIPDTSGTTAAFLAAVRGDSWHYVAFLITFVSIAGSWSSHHDIFRHTRRVDGRLRQLDMTWLLMIVLLPFAMRLLSSSGSQTQTVHALIWSFYALVQALESAILLAMLRYMTASGLSAGLPEQTVKAVTRQSSVLAAGFGLSIPVFFATSYGWVVWIAVPVAAHVWDRSRRAAARRRPPAA